MPTAQQIAAIYDFEGIFEDALKAVLTANEIKAFTTQDFGKLDAAGKPVIDFQNARPRVEISFTPGAGQGRWREVNIDGVLTPLEIAWSGQYKLDLITAADITIHAAFRTMIRFLMHSMGNRINNVEPMVNHTIQPFFKDSGTTPVMKPQEGYLQTTMLFDIDFSVQDYAWTEQIEPTT